MNFRGNNKRFSVSTGTYPPQPTPPSEPIFRNYFRFGGSQNTNERISVAIYLLDWAFRFKINVRMHGSDPNVLQTLIYFDGLSNFTSLRINLNSSQTEIIWMDNGNTYTSIFPNSTSIVKDGLWHEMDFSVNTLIFGVRKCTLDIDGSHHYEDDGFATLSAIQLTRVNIGTMTSFDIKDVYLLYIGGNGFIFPCTELVPEEGEPLSEYVKDKSPYGNNGTPYSIYDSSVFFNSSPSIINYYRFAKTALPLLTPSHLVTNITELTPYWKFCFDVRFYDVDAGTTLPIFSGRIDGDNWFLIAYNTVAGYFFYTGVIGGVSAGFKHAENLNSVMQNWNHIEIECNYDTGLCSISINHSILELDEVTLIAGTPRPSGFEIRIGWWFSNAYLSGVDISNLKFSSSSQTLFYHRCFEYCPDPLRDLSGYTLDYSGLGNNSTPKTIMSPLDFFRHPIMMGGYLSDSPRTSYSLKGESVSYVVKDQDSYEYVRKIGNRYTADYGIYDFNEAQKYFLENSNGEILDYCPHIDADLVKKAYVDCYFDLFTDYPKSRIILILTDLDVSNNPDIELSELPDPYDWQIADNFCDTSLFPKIKMGVNEYIFTPDPNKPTNVKFSIKNQIDKSAVSTTGRLHRRYVRDANGRVIQDISYEIERYLITPDDYKLIRIYDGMDVVLYLSRDDVNYAFNCSCDITFLHYQDSINLDYAKLKFTIRDRITL